MSLDKDDLISLIVSEMFALASVWWQGYSNITARPAQWLYRRQVEVFPRRSEYPASRRVLSYCLVAQPHDAVHSGVASYANSTSSYLFMLIADKKENTRLGPSVLLWASCWLVYASSSHRFVCCHSSLFLSIFESRTGGLYGDRHQFHSVR